jgi:hypothetical protein
VTTRLLTAALGLCLVPALVRGRGEAEWKVFTSKEGGFSVSLPGTPAEDRRTTRSAAGTFPGTVYILEGKKGDGFYLAGFTDLPASVFKAGTDAQRLDSARDEAVAHARGKLKDEKRIDLKGHPGRELLIEVDAKTFVQARFYLVRQRLYQVLVLGSKDVPGARNTLRFLDSFRLVP